MKRNILLFSCILTLVVGLLTGYVVRGLIPSTRSTHAIRNSVTATVSAQMGVSSAVGDSAAQVGNVALVTCAMDVAEAFNEGDYATLAAYVHPQDGVTFTPYSTVDLTSNLHFTASQIGGAGSDSSTYVWGICPDTGKPIKLTISDFVGQYLCDVSYTAAPEIGVDTVLHSGNALENVAEAYPDCRFVDFYQPGTGSDNKNWSALKLVFSWYQNDWYLVGVIHSSWTA